MFKISAKIPDSTRFHVGIPSEVYGIPASVRPLGRSSIFTHSCTLASYHNEHGCMCVCMHFQYFWRYNFCSSNWIKIHGEEYHHGDYILIGKQTDDLPVFAKITDLMAIVDYPVAEVNVCRTVGLINHLMSYFHCTFVVCH